MNYHPTILDRHVGIDNVCAWPNIKRLPNGEIGAFIFNRPSHGKMEGDIELWVSDTGTSPWRKRSTVTEHSAGTVRMNMAAGVLANGTIVVLASGWDLSFRDPIRTQNILPNVQICRTSDNGRSWQIDETPISVGDATRFIPFGNIVEGHDTIGVAMYDCRMNATDRVSRTSTTHFFGSGDGGSSWKPRGVIGQDGYTETDILNIDDGWLAAVRTLADYAHPEDPLGKPRVVVSHGNPSGSSWSAPANLTLPDQHPGNLIRLTDGRILFTCGSRVVGFLGVFSCVSADDGKTWSEPIVIVNDGLSRDMGYPSSIELESGAILTAYYAKSTAGHYRYHMATTCWQLKE